jgi:hypothetical protein
MNRQQIWRLFSSFIKLVWGVSILVVVMILLPTMLGGVKHLTNPYVQIALVISGLIAGAPEIWKYVNWVKNGDKG